MTSAFIARLAPAALAALVLAAGCAAPPAATPERPRLVVLLVVDGLPQRQVTAYRDQLGPDGLNRFLGRGAWFTEARYGHADTLTAPGHATILTGAPPRATGIIGNEWRDPATGAPVYCVGDPGHRYLGHATAPLAGTSPANLRAQSLGDVLKAADARSKVVAISGKDRGAILPAGRDGTAYVFMPQTGRFDSTTYYMKELPAWVASFNRARPADRYFRATWSPLLPDMAYARSVADDQPWFARGGKLPKTTGEGLDAPGPQFYGSLYQGPFLDALLLEFARAALDGESLGQDDAPDLLAVSLSSHDYVNHAWGAESRLSHDHVLQVDQLIGGFLRALDRKVGPDRYVVVLTADHGFMPAPEFARSRGMEGGRLHPGQVLAALEAGLAPRFGEGPWVRGWSAQGILLDRLLAARRGAGERDLAEAAARILRADPGIAAAYTRAQIEDDSTPPAPFLDAVRKGWHRELAADVKVVMKPGWMLSSYGTGTTHGSPHDYDAHVPMLFYGPQWVKPGRIDEPVEVADIAPTLAALLGVAAPSSAEGRAFALRP